MISKEDIDKAISRLKSIDENTEEYDGNLFKADFEIVLQYIDELENKTKELGKGQQSLIQSRRKWKRRYYKMKRKNKELQEAVELIEAKIKKYELETIPQLQGEISVSKQVHEYDEQMIDMVKRESSRTI